MTMDIKHHLYFGALYYSKNGGKDIETIEECSIEGECYNKYGSLLGYVACTRMPDTWEGMYIYKIIEDASVLLYSYTDNNHIVSVLLTSPDYSYTIAKDILKAMVRAYHCKQVLIIPKMRKHYIPPCRYIEEILLLYQRAHCHEEHLHKIKDNHITATLSLTAFIHQLPKVSL